METNHHPLLLPIQRNPEQNQTNPQPPTKTRKEDGSRRYGFLSLKSIPKSRICVVLLLPNPNPCSPKAHLLLLSASDAIPQRASRPQRTRVTWRRQGKTSASAVPARACSARSKLRIQPVPLNPATLHLQGALLRRPQSRRPSPACRSSHRPHHLTGTRQRRPQLRAVHRQGHAQVVVVEEEEAAEGSPCRRTERHGEHHRLALQLRQRHRRGSRRPQHRHRDLRHPRPLLLPRLG